MGTQTLHSNWKSVIGFDCPHNTILDIRHDSAQKIRDIKNLLGCKQTKGYTAVKQI